MTTIKAKFGGRVFVPEEPVDLPAGYEPASAIDTPPAENGAKKPKTALQERVEIPGRKRRELKPIHGDEPPWPDVRC